MENFESNLQTDKPTQKPEKPSGAGIKGRFNPDEEIQKLWLVPKERRREAMSTFKDKLSRQRGAWALCRTAIEEKIEANPDIPKQELVGIINHFASSYGFAKSHISTAEQLIDDYIAQHKRVQEIREEYPDDIALVNRLTKMRFSRADAEDFNIKVGPVSVEISCSGFNAGRIFERSDDPVVGFNYGGFASQSRDKKPVYYLVVNNDFALQNPIYHATTVPHEREHLKNKILGPKLYGQSGVRADVRERLNRGTIGFLRHRLGERLLGFERKFEDEVFTDYNLTKDPKEKAFLLGEYMRLKREDALNQAKNEIMAMKAEPYGVYGGYNIFLEGKGDAYDYLAYLRNWDKKKDDPLWQETSRRVLVEEYRDIVDGAIAAFDRLKSGGYPQKEVIAMLTDRRLSEWPKTVKRLLKTKKE